LSRLLSFGVLRYEGCVEKSRVVMNVMYALSTPFLRLHNLSFTYSLFASFKIESILIKDISFTKELQESLSSAAQAKRVGESKVIAAKAEVDSAKLMREASEILNTPAAMQIRYLETMASMSRNPGTKVIFMPSASSGPAVGAGQSFGLSPVQACIYENMADKL
jgi:hypothetical protein